MPLKNMTAIQTVTVESGGAASIDFTNIPQTYTDLVIMLSGRSNRASTDGDNWTLSFNGSNANFSYRLLYGAGSGNGASANGSNNTNPYVSAANQTANTFGNVMAYIPNYTSSNYKSISVDGVSETNATTAYMGLNASLWSNTAAITSISLGVYNGTGFLQYSSATLYGISNTIAGGAKAYGGTVTEDANYFYHTFLASGTFTPTQNLTADYLVVAGGGGGGANVDSAPGGGGAGGLRSTVTATGGGGSLESALSLTASTNYTVTIGAGGTAGTYNTDNATNGSNSVFSTITSTGGGRGATVKSGPAWQVPSSGGSGGGGAGNAGGGTGGAGTTNQGYAGGNATGSGAGGGGAGAVGTAGGGTYPNAGGAGVAVAISGSSITYAKGGDGGGNSAAGDANTGNGGNSGFTPGGNGGSGIVIIRYAK